MFKELKNEALIEFTIEVDSPLAIKSGTKNVLDPSLPDDQVMRQLRDGRMQEVIPGSSLKGVFRSRAEQILRGLEYKIDDPFETGTASRKAEGTGKERYEQLCPVSKIFGSLSLNSRIRFADAYPIDPDQVKTGIRNGVGINRVTGGSQRGALFDLEVVESGQFKAQANLQNFELWQLSLVLWLINDLNQGHIRLGSATSRGFGLVRVPEVKVTVRTYTPLKKNPAPITGVLGSSDQTKQEVQWKNEWVSASYTGESLEHWIGDGGLLQGIPMPSKERKTRSS